MRSRWVLPLALLTLVACQMTLASGLGSESKSAPPPLDRPRPGCRLNLATHAAKCPCALSEDIDQLPDRPDLESLDLELHESADAAGLDRLSHLRGLSVNNITQQQLVRVTLLTRLESLTLLSHEKLDLTLLASEKNLRSLTLGLVGEPHACDIASAIDTIAQLSKLEKLTVAARCDHEIDITPLARIPGLREVSMRGVAPTEESRAKLPNAKIAASSNTIREDGGNDLYNICDIDPSACPAASACH